MLLSIYHRQPIVSLAAGVLILTVPRLLNYIVAFFLIISWVIGLGLIHQQELGESSGCRRQAESSTRSFGESTFSC